MVQKRLPVVVAFVALDSFLLGSGVAHSDKLDLTKVGDQTQIQPGTRVLGMGGTYLFQAPSSAGIYNPASLLASKGNLESDGLISVNGQTQNLNVKDIVNLGSDLSDLNDQADNGIGANSVTAVQGSFNDVFQFAQNAGAVNGGAPATIGAKLDSGTGHSFGSFGLSFAGTAFTAVQLGTNDTGLPNGKSLAIFGQAQSFVELGVPVAHNLSFGTLGLTPKLQRADVLGFDFNASELTDSISGQTYNRVNSQKFDMDIGFTSLAYTKYRLQGAVVVRNVFSPTFNLPASVSSTTGVPPAAPRANFNFKLKPSYDIGVNAARLRIKGLTATAEVHNVGGANGDSSTFHFGTEYAVAKTFAVRAGIDDGHLTLGAGIGLPLIGALQVAVGSDPRQRFSLGFFGTMGFDGRDHSRHRHGKSSPDTNPVTDVVPAAPAAAAMPAIEAPAAQAPANPQVLYVTSQQNALDVAAAGNDSPSGQAPDRALASAGVSHSYVHLHFATPLDAMTASDRRNYAVEVNGAVSRVATADYNGTDIMLALPSSIKLQPGDKIVISYRGLRDASGITLTGHTASVDLW